MNVPGAGRPGHWRCGSVLLWLPLVGILLAITASPALPKEQTTGSNTTFVERNCLYLNIDSFAIHIDPADALYPDVTSEELNRGNIKNHVWGYCDDHSLNIITFTRHYWTINGSDDDGYNITMTFEQDPTSTNDEWYMSGFKHRNQSYLVNHTIFQYSGVEHAITASGDMGYYCANNLTFSGKAGISDLTSQLTLVNLHVQAFHLKGNTPSSTYHDCGKDSSNNFVINLTIGLVVGGTVLLALVAILVILALRKVRHRGYNLLDS